MDIHITRGVLLAYRTVDGRPRWQVKSTAGEVLEGLEVFEAYGFANQPRVGAGCLILTPGGKAREQSVLICPSHPAARPETPAGDVVVFDDSGALVRLSGGAVTIDASQTTINSNVEINGDVTINGKVTVSDSIKTKTLEASESIEAKELKVTAKADLNGAIKINNVTQVGN